MLFHLLKLSRLITAWLSGLVVELCVLVLQERSCLHPWYSFVSIDYTIGGECKRQHYDRGLIIMQPIMSYKVPWHITTKDGICHMTVPFVPAPPKMIELALCVCVCAYVRVCIKAMATDSELHQMTSLHPTTACQSLLETPDTGVDVSVVCSWNVTSSVQSAIGGGDNGRVAQQRRSFLDDALTRVILYAIIFVLAVAGNALVIATLAHDRRMRTVTNLFLLNLAVSDLLLAVLCMPFTLIPTLQQNFTFGKAMCVLIRYMQGELKPIHSCTRRHDRTVISRIYDPGCCDDAYTITSTQKCSIY